MKIAREREGDVVVLRPGQRLDMKSGPALVAAVNEAVAAGDRRLVLDMARVTYVSSMGLAACLKAAKRIQAEGGGIALAGLTETVAEVFEVTGFDRLFAVFGSRGEAVRALGSAAAGG